MQLSTCCSAVIDLIVCIFYVLVHVEKVLKVRIFLHNIACHVECVCHGLIKWHASLSQEDKMDTCGHVYTSLRRASPSPKPERKPIS